MKAHHPNILMLETVASGLGALRERVVFVGGATTSLYITDPGASDIRPTDDVDCIIEVASTGEYYRLEAELRSLGFRNGDPSGGPICRWLYQGVKVDIMPDDQAIIGFTNRWYAEGIQARHQTLLPSGTEIFVLPVPYYIATKLEAYRGRGDDDLRMSHDIEDTVAILDGCSEILTELTGAAGDLGEYLAVTFRHLLAANEFSEALHAHLSGPLRGQRAERIIKMLSTVYG